MRVLGYAFKAFANEGLVHFTAVFGAAGFVVYEQLRSRLIDLSEEIGHLFGHFLVIWTNVLKHFPDDFYALEFVRSYVDAELEILCVVNRVRSTGGSTQITDVATGGILQLRRSRIQIVFFCIRISNHIQITLKFVDLQEHLADKGKAAGLDPVY